MRTENLGPPFAYVRVRTKSSIVNCCWSWIRTVCSPQSTRTHVATKSLVMRAPVFRTFVLMSAFVACSDARVGVKGRDAGAEPVLAAHQKQADSLKADSVKRAQIVRVP